MNYPNLFPPGIFLLCVLKLKYIYLHLQEKVKHHLTVEIEAQNGFDSKYVHQFF